MIGFVTTSTVAVLVLLTGGLYATQRWFGAWGTSVLYFSAAVNLGASWLAFVPVVLVRRRRPDYLPQAAMASMTLRILICASVLLGATIVGSFDTWALSIWMLVFYLSLLVVETAMAARLVRFGMTADRNATQ